MNIDEILKSSGRDLNDVTRIYHGYDHSCRCGCGGKYFDRGSRGFTRSINALRKPGTTCLGPGTGVTTRHGEHIVSNGLVAGRTYINIPYDAARDKCYTLYFD